MFWGYDPGISALALRSLRLCGKSIGKSDFVKDSAEIRVLEGKDRIPWPRTIMNDKTNQLTQQIIGCAIEVHRQLGPGLLESIYEAALAVEFDQASIPYDRQTLIPVRYKDRVIGEHRIDLIAGNQVVLELKAVARHEPIFDAQLLTYLRLSRCPVGLLINFNTRLLKDGIKRMILAQGLLATEAESPQSAD
jgi:GxxExxY protein